MRQHVQTYAVISKVLHWLIALIVIAMLSLSFFLEDLPKAFSTQAYMIHKSFGLTILFLMFVRIISIIYCGRPSLPPTVSRLEKWLSRAVQYSFYGLLILMPLSGWVLSVAKNRIPYYFGLFPMPIPGIGPNELLSQWMDLSHKVIAWLLIALIILHVAGALKHHLINRDNVLRRLWF